MRSSATPCTVVGCLSRCHCEVVSDNLIFFCAGAAVIFFVLYDVNMVFLTWYSPRGEGEGHIRWSHVLRQLCTVIAGVALVAFIVMSILPVLSVAHSMP